MTGIDDGLTFERVRYYNTPTSLVNVKVFKDSNNNLLAVIDRRTAAIQKQFKAAIGEFSGPVIELPTGVSNKKGNIIKWTSDNPYVADIANKIEELYPGHVVDVNKKIYDANGKLVTDFDIITQNAVIQVKRKGNGLGPQLEITQSQTDKVVIGYGPKLKLSVVKDVQKRGILVTKDINTLLQVIKP